MSLRQYTNAPATALTSSVSNLANAIDVESIIGFPPTFPFILILDRNTSSEEVVLATAGSGNTFTVTRGYDGTTAFSHASGAVVEHGISAIDPREANEHVNSDSGVHGVVGNVVGDTDTQTLTHKDLSDGTNTFPVGEVVGTTETQTLTNKDLSDSSNTFGASSFIPTGVIWEFGGSTAPTGWLLCDGSVVSQTTYAALFAEIGTAFNTGGEGAGNFRLPDRRDRVGMGASGTKPLGDTGGSDTATIASANLPTHTHSAGTLDTNTTGSNHTHSLGLQYRLTGAGGSSLTEVTDIDDQTGAGGTVATATTGTSGSGHTHGVTGSTGNGGFANDPLDVLNPYVAVNYIIKI